MIKPRAQLTLALLSLVSGGLILGYLAYLDFDAYTQHVFNQIKSEYRMPNYFEAFACPDSLAADQVVEVQVTLRNPASEPVDYTIHFSCGYGCAYASQQETSLSPGQVQRFTFPIRYTEAGWKRLRVEAIAHKDLPMPRYSVLPNSFEDECDFKVVGQPGPVQSVRSLGWVLFGLGAAVLILRRASAQRPKNKKPAKPA
jgi:hypothetical protein